MRLVSLRGVDYRARRMRQECKFGARFGGRAEKGGTKSRRARDRERAQAVQVQVWACVWNMWVCAVRQCDSKDSSRQVRLGYWASGRWPSCDSQQAAGSRQGGAPGGTTVEANAKRQKAEKRVGRSGISGSEVDSLTRKTHRELYPVLLCTLPYLIALCSSPC